MKPMTPPAERVSILLVDDQPSRLLSYEAILEELGENLVRAGSGQEALHLLMRQEFAVILLDVNMPTMDGFETANLIHQHPRYEKTPIIFVTAVHINDLDRLKGYELGAVDYVYIPVVPEILRSKVAVLVELYRNRRELRDKNEDLRRANEELERANDLLRAEKTRELQELNRTLEEANARLEAANLTLSESASRKDEFLALLAHELRNPLNPVRNVIEVLRMDTSPPQVEWGRDLIDKQVRHLTRLIDDLLDINRISMNRLVLVRQALDLREVLTAALDASLDGRTVHPVTTSFPETAVELHGDPVRLTQVFTNLLNNALKFTPAGKGVHVSVTRTDEDDPPVVEVRVRDEGVGIPADKLGRLFELFYQVDSSLTRSHGGLGIGLALVRRLVELHGGGVAAYSAGPGLGSEFVVRLPVNAPAAAEPAPVTSRAGESPGAHRVLVVDDNPDSVDSLALLLTLRGHTVASARSGEAAIETAESFRPDLVLLDIGMPGMSGHDVARTIRAKPWGREVILIALTGWGTDEDRQHSRAAGFDHHLVKPLEPSDLDAAFARLKDRSPVH
jgi:signal transduction histidine kinase